MIKINISKEHIEFIRLVAEGITFEKAFVTSCNKSVTPGYARSYGSRLAKKYAKEIQQAKEHAQKVIEHAKDKKVVKNALNQVLAQAEVDAELCKIIKGESKVKKPMFVNGKLKDIECDPDHSDKLRAIDLYNKRFGSNAPAKTDLTTKGESLNKQLDLSKLSDAELRTIAKLQSKAGAGQA